MCRNIYDHRDPLSLVNDDTMSFHDMPFVKQNPCTNINFILGYTLITTVEWRKQYFAKMLKMRLWDINLRLISVLSSDGQSTFPESQVVKLWKSSYLMEQRKACEADVDSSSVNDTTTAAAAATFENHEEWLSILKDKMTKLCTELEVGDDQTTDGYTTYVSMNIKDTASAAPLVPLVVELESLLYQISLSDDNTNSTTNLNCWIAEMLLSVKIRCSSIARAYACILKLQAKGFELKRIIKLLQSFTYVLKKWIHRANNATKSHNDGGSQSDLNDLNHLKSTNELNQWLDLIRHHLSDMYGKTHISQKCKDDMKFIHKDYQNLINEFDSLK